MLETIPNLKQPEEKIEQKEYNFDEGVAVIVEKIESLLHSGQKYVVVSMNGSGIEVGKTRLTAEISIILKNKGIAVLNCSNVNDMWVLKDDLLAEAKQEIPAEQIVIIFEADTYTASVLPKTAKEKMLETTDKIFQTKASQIGLPANKIDLRVGVYRPDRPFPSVDGSEVFADIIINNEKAHNRKNNI